MSLHLYITLTLNYKLTYIYDVIRREDMSPLSIDIHVFQLKNRTRSISSFFLSVCFSCRYDLFVGVGCGGGGGGGGDGGGEGFEVEMVVFFLLISSPSPPHPKNMLSIMADFKTVNIYIRYA